MKLLIVGASSYQGYLYEAALKHKIQIYAVDANKSSPMFSKAKEYKPIDIFDIDKVVEFAKKNQIDAVTTINIDQGMVAVGEIQRRLGLKSLPKESIDICVKKDLMRNYWQMQNINIPKYKVFNYSEKVNALKFIKNISHDLIVKPTDNAAKRGISKIEPNDKDISKKIENAYKNSKSGKIVLEEFIKGDLYFVPTYVKDDTEVEASLIKQEYNQNYVQIQYTAPAEVNQTDKSEIINEAIKAVKNLGNGPYHTEIIYSKEKGSVLVETSPRISYATVGLTRLIEGFDPVTQLLNDAFEVNKLDPYCFDNDKLNCARLTHIQPKPGKTYNGKMNGYCDQSSGIYEVRSVVDEGHEVSEFNTNSDRVMYFISYAETISELEQISKDFEEELITKCFVD